MRIWWATAILLVAVVAGLGIAAARPREEPSLVTVEQLIGHHAHYDGRFVRVRGFLSACAAENCALTSKPIDTDNLSAWHASGGEMLSISYGPGNEDQGNRLFRAWYRLAGRRLIDAQDRWFDRQTSAFRNRPVTIDAQFSDVCLRGHVVCLDRVPELKPVGWHPLRPNEEI